ncbi:MAG TPA: response regulator [Marinagarivorans sp.]|nr:response regulator [Cellvibrionaceae bacterium]HMY37886.1 response regulator [Marinagarivorans sp.]HNG59261.1 response regulator [Cellvibrionaceae bacterium]
MLWASILPLGVLSCILLLADILALHTAQRHIYQNSFELAHRLLTQFELLSDQPIDHKKFNQLADILLSDSEIVGLSLSDEKNQIVYQAGVASHPHNALAGKTPRRNNPQNADENWLVQIPNGAYTWTLVVDDERIHVAFYQNLLFHLIIFGASLLILMFIYVQTKAKFLGPIRTLTHYLLSLKLSPHHAIPDPNQLSFLNDCALLMNEVIENLNRAQDDLRNSYEAALSDFKESLESVEIQNIEMDMARKEAIQAERVKAEFLMHASSDLLDPLRQCLGAIGQLSRTTMTAEQADYINNLETTLRGIIGLAQDIVDFSRLENGKFQLDVKNVQVRQVVHEALSFYAPLAATKSNRVLSIIQPDVMEILLGDPRRLQQVLGNLINQALNHGRQGNIAIKVSVVRAETSAQLVKFSVINYSGGFDDDFVAHFKRLLESKHGDFAITQGTALGLSIARNLVEKMGGTLGIDLEPADQPSIWFTARLQVPQSRLQQPATLAPLKGCHVLVIDEQPASRLELTTLLTSLGANFLEVTAMDDLVHQLPRWREFKPQIAVVDVLNRANQFDKEATLTTIAQCNELLGISCLVVTSSTTTGSIQKDVDPINAGIITRPLLPGKLHQALAHQISVTPILGAINSTPKVIPSLKPSFSHRLLVVDDNPSNTKLIAEFLKPFPLEVVTCSSGASALALCRERRFDLVFMDIQMPDADGFAVTAKIRELELGDTRTPIVALTAQNAAENKTKYIVGGMDDYLSKPVSYEELVQLLSKWLGKKFTRPAAPPSAPPAPLPALEQAEVSHQPVVVVQESLKLAKDNAALARDMLQMLIESLQQEPVDWAQLLADNNWGELQNAAHKLYGGACYCGVPALKEAAHALDRDLQLGQLDTIEHKVALLCREIQRLLDWSEDYDLDALFELV